MMHMPPYQYVDATFHDANVPYRDANATSIFLNAKCPFMEMQMRLLYDANFPCRDVQSLFMMMQVPSCGCKFFFRYKMPLVGMS